MIWKCPENTRKSKPLENPRESLRPLKAIVAPQRRERGSGSSSRKDKKEEAILQVHHEAEDEKTESQRSLGVQVNLETLRVETSDAETQSENEYKTKDDIKDSIERGKKDAVDQEPEAQRRVLTLNCLPRKTDEVVKDNSETLNTNIVSFVSTR